MANLRKCALAGHEYDQDLSSTCPACLAQETNASVIDKILKRKSEENTAAGIQQIICAVCKTHYAAEYDACPRCADNRKQTFPQFHEPVSHYQFNRSLAVFLLVFIVISSIAAGWLLGKLLDAPLACATIFGIVGFSYGMIGYEARKVFFDIADRLTEIRDILIRSKH